MKRKISYLLTIAFGVSMLASCGNNTTTQPTTPSTTTSDSATPATTESKEPAAEGDAALEPATFSIWTWAGSTEDWGAKDLNEVAAFQEIEKNTNTKIEWVMESDTSTFDLIMASGEVPDAIYYAWNPIRQGQYSKDGIIQNIMPYIESSAPDIKKLIDTDPKVKQQLVREDGSVYLVPWLTTDMSMLAGEGFAIRQDWLDKVSLPVPTNPDELFDALMAFREQDANGNGKKDEIISCYLTQFGRSAYAFGAADGNGDAFIFGDDGKTVVYSPATDNYKNWLTWMNKLYTNNLIDPDIFLQDSDIYMKKAMENRLGVYVDNPGVLAKIVKENEANGVEVKWTPMNYMNYNGNSINYSSAYKRYVQPYGLAVSSKVENPERFLEWFNYLFTEEGNDLLNWGVKDVSYTGEGDNRKYTDAVLADPVLEKGSALSKYASPGFVGVQSLLAVNALSDPFTLSCRTAWAATDVSKAMEPFVAFNTDEQQVNTDLRTNLNTLKDSWRDKFITGEASIEKDWDKYIAELNSYRVDELVKIYQDAADRYAAK